MKTLKNFTRCTFMLLLMQFVFVSAAGGQEPSDAGDSLVASLPRLLNNETKSTLELRSLWEQVRRGELLTLFEDHVYGRVPESDVRISYRTLREDREALQGRGVEKEVAMEISNGEETLSVTMLIFLPGEARGPVPLFLGLNFNGNHCVHPDPEISITESWVRNNPALGINDNRATEASRGTASSRWPVELILSRGYGLATIYYGDIDPDFDDGFKNGVHGIMDPEGIRRDSSSWGSIAAWAWGLSRAMDYFETDGDIDERRVAVMGHSRLGKTALWAGATDERFALVISNDSGCGGAALSRRPFGERVLNINTSFPHWFASGFHKFNDNEGALPVDQHMLLALMAPRPLYVASAEEDQWADPQGEYLSLYYGSGAFGLYDSNSTLKHQMPSVDQPVCRGSLAYHMRSGGHDVTGYDWEQFLSFADAQLKSDELAVFENPVSQAWIEAHLLAAHPRLILSSGLEQSIRQQLDSGDSLVNMGLELIRRNADSILHLDPLVRQMTGKRLLSVSREAISRLTTLSFAYRFKRNPSHLQKLEEELKAVCSFNDWNPSHFLDVSEMAAGVALAIDWAGEWMAPEVQQLARNALIEKALKPGLGPSGNTWWITSTNNWNLVCHGGLSLASLAVFEDAPELATDILFQAVEYIPLALEPYAPDGIYPEGVSYWFYATTYLTTVISAFESALGTDFGFTGAPGVRESAVFSQVMAGPSGEYYDFFDSGLGGFHSLTHLGLLSWFARRSGEAFPWDAYARLLNRDLAKMEQVRGSRFYPVQFLYLAQPGDENQSEFVWPDTWNGGGDEPIAILRDPNNRRDAFFLAAKGGRAADNHGNMDAGSFVFELDGIRWSLDPGNQSYNELEQVMGEELWNSDQDSPRWSLLTKNNFGHSTLTVNGDLHRADGRASLISADFSRGYPEFTFGMTPIYGEDLKKAERSFGRPSASVLRIRDEFLFSEKSQNLSWQLITRADVREEKDHLILQQDGKQLLLKPLLEVPFTFRIIALSPPPMSYDKDIAGLKRIELEVDRKSYKGNSGSILVELSAISMK